jgi:hypothetical protein
MFRYLWVSLAAGVLFAFLDAVINANPLAARLMGVFQPLARDSVAVRTGILLDLLYGFVLAGVFLLLRESLPGSSGAVKGLSLGVLVWFFRVFMSVGTQWVVFKVSPQWALYTLATGLAEMLLLGLFLGITLTTTNA